MSTWEQNPRQLDIPKDQPPALAAETENKAQRSHLATCCLQYGLSRFLLAGGRQSLGPSGIVRTAFIDPGMLERALRLVSPGGVIREGEAGHSLPGRSGRCRAEGSRQGVPMSGLWAPGGGGSHICSRAWTSRKNNSLHQGYSLNPPSLNHHLS